MAVVDQGHRELTDTLNEVLQKMGDLKGATINIIDQSDGEPTGNDRAAQLLEAFTAGEGKSRVVTIVTTDLSLDSRSYETLLGQRAFGSQQEKPGALHEKFAGVSVSPVTPAIMKQLAEKMIDECALNRNMQLGLKTIIAEDFAAGKIKRDDGFRGLRRHLNEYLKRPLTDEWRETLIAKSPLTVAIQAINNGMSCEVEAPGRAVFGKRKDKGPQS